MRDELTQPEIDRLNVEQREAYDDFIDNYADLGCRCHLCPPCSYCTHQGHPEPLRIELECDDDL